MPSIMTQNISVASAQVAPQQTQPAGQTQNAGVGVQNGSQLAQVSQSASARATNSLKEDDRNRGVQIPKRVEGKFGSQARKKTQTKGSPAEEEEAKSATPKNDGLDVVA